jgi:hypothetical protein
MNLTAEIALSKSLPHWDNPLFGNHIGTHNLNQLLEMHLGCGRSRLLLTQETRPT